MLVNTVYTHDYTSTDQGFRFTLRSFLPGRFSFFGFGFDFDFNLGFVAVTLSRLKGSLHRFFYFLLFFGFWTLTLLV
jgi:hypothetical protein